MRYHSTPLARTCCFYRLPTKLADRHRQTDCFSSSGITFTILILIPLPNPNPNPNSYSFAHSFYSSFCLFTQISPTQDLAARYDNGLVSAGKKNWWERAPLVNTTYSVPASQHSGIPVKPESLCPGYALPTHQFITQFHSTLNTGFPKFHSIHATISATFTQTCQVVRAKRRGGE